MSSRAQREISKYTFGISLFLILAQSLGYAQTQPLKLKVKAFPEKITVGDEVRLVLRVSLPKGFTLEPLPGKINLSPFELKRIEKESASEKSGRLVEMIALTLTTFQLGEVVIPQIPLKFKDEAGHVDQVLTRSVPIKVVSVLKNPKEAKDIRPIKGPVPLGQGLLRNLFLGGLVFLFLVILCVKIIVRRRQKIIEDLESLKPPGERAKLELGRLLEKQWIESGKVKEFYSELADILRRYLERQLKVQALELTTVEILQNLKAKEYDRSVTARIKDVLENSDLVKFAKFVPPRSWSETSVNELSQIVELTAPRLEIEAKPEKQKR